MSIICHGNAIPILECCLTSSSDCTPRVLPREEDGDVEVEQQIQRITTSTGTGSGSTPTNLTGTRQARMGALGGVPDRNPGAAPRRFCHRSE